MAKTTSTKKGFSCEPGDIFTFKTRPYWKYAPKVTNRFGAFKVIGQLDEVNIGGFKMAGHVTVVAVLDVISSGKPASPEQLTDAAVLVSKRFFYGQDPRTCIYQIDSSTIRKLLTDLTLAAKTKVSAAERDLLKPGKRPGFTDANAITMDAEGEWRWRHDRKAFQAEMDAREIEHGAAPGKPKTRWAKLKKEKHFSGWSLMPQAFRLEARMLVQEAAGALEKLGARPRKTEVKSILKGLVKSLNRLDAKHGDVIETVEAEDLMRVIGVMAALAGHPDVVADVEAGREW